MAFQYIILCKSSFQHFDMTSVDYSKMSQFRFTPLYGARDEGPICSLLEVDDVRILLDCGWNETLDESLLEPLRDVCKQVQLVLITHGDFNHAGALPYAVSKFNLNCTIYATKAAKFLAEQTIKAFFKTKSSEQFFSLFTLEDIDRTFRLFDELAYSEYRNIKRHNSFIKIRSQAAGHSVGGAFWEISNEIDKIIYAVDYNHQRDRHLNRTVLETFTQPTLLITDAINALEPKIRRREIDEQILHSIQETLVAGGNVLIPVDTAGRTFEVLILLDFFVHTRQLQAPVIFLDETSSDVVRKTAKTFRDLMIKAKGDSNVEDCPLEVKHIRFFHKLDDLKPIVQPKVVVTYSSSLELGLSRVLFARWASDPRNKVIFTHRPDPGTLAQTILTNTKINDIIQIELRTLIPLDGVELESYLQNRRIQKEKEEQERRAREDGRLENINNFDDNSDNDEDELVHKKGKKISPSWAQYRLKKMFLSATRKYEAENLMYTFEEARFVSDDYGEEINMELFQEKLPQPIQVQEQPNQTKDEIEEEENEKEDEVPKKEFREVHEIRVCCAFEYINLEGRSDGESVKSILSNMKPKSVILFHGQVPAVDNLQKYLQGLTIERHGEKISMPVYIPGPGDVTQFTSDKKGYKIMLAGDVIADVQFTKKVMDYEIGWIFGQLRPEPQSTTPGSLVLASSSQGLRAAKAPRGNLLIGDKTLAEIKDLVAKNGFKAELDSGVLTCNSKVKIRKPHPGNLCIDGPLCQEYFEIRKLVYGQFSVV